MPLTILNSPQNVLLDNFSVDLNILYQNGVNSFGQPTFQSLAATGISIGNGFVLTAAHNFILTTSSDQTLQNQG